MGKADPGDCWDAMVNGDAGDEELDNILSILDFPVETLEGDGFIGDWDDSKSSHYLVPIPSDVLMDTGPPVLPPPINATPELKELSSYLPKDSPRSFIIQPNKSTEAQEAKGRSQTQSPISVLESNSSGKIPLSKSCKRARSKRARPSGLSTWLSMLQPSATARKGCIARKNSESRSKLSQLSAEKDSSDKAKNQFQATTKRCAHCQVTRTPQWREGPAGPKTLCNACGVRYRSGRLFPEYRPAASPTFVPSLHSNSHRKVVEMRTKGMKHPGTKVEQPSMSPEMQFVPMSNYLFDYPMC